MLAVVTTVIAAAGLFWALGAPPRATMRAIFVEPLQSAQGLSELSLKAAPLILIAVGLAAGFRAGVWNIGAEGQLLMGAIAGGGVALATYEQEGHWILPAMAVAGVLGGMAWAAIPALLRTWRGVNEIFVSLMLTYVAELFLNWLVLGPWKDPEGLNFPQSRMFSEAAQLPVLIAGTRFNAGIPVSLLVAAIAAVVMRGTVLGFQIRLVGAAPAAARYAGVSERRIVWTTLLASGGLAGLAGVFEVAGPIGQLIPRLTPGYGFTAIIVAFLGRLRPGGDRAGRAGGGAVVDRGGQCAGVARAAECGGGGGAGDAVVLPVGVGFLVAVSDPAGGGVTFAVFLSLLASVVTAATPLLLAATGELVVERSGVLNLGVEGMMLVGAVAGFAATSVSGSAVVGIAAAGLAGMALAGLFAALTLGLTSNQVATGLALTIFGVGLSALAGAGFVGQPVARLPRLPLPFLGGPFVGVIKVLRQDGLTYFSVAAVAWVLRRTRAGLVLRAVGEADRSAHGLGYGVLRIRCFAVLFGGFMAGLAGADLSLSYTPMWVEDMTAGRGWIALALVVFGTWQPWRVLLGAYLFGGITILQLYLQGSGMRAVPTQFLAMLPYVATIVVLAAMSSRSARRRLGAPACLGLPFRPAT